MSLQTNKSFVREDKVVKKSFSSSFKDLGVIPNKLKDEHLDVEEIKEETTIQEVPATPNDLASPTETSQQTMPLNEPKVTTEQTDRKEKDIAREIKAKIKPKKERGVQRTFYYEKEISDYIDNLCKETGAGPSEIIRFILRDYMETHK